MNGMGGTTDTARPESRRVAETTGRTASVASAASASPHRWLDQYFADFRDFSRDALCRIM